MQKPIEGTTVLLVGPTSSSVPTLLLSRRQLRVLWAASFPEACTVAESTSPRLVLVFGRLGKKLFSDLARVVATIPDSACVYIHESGDHRRDARMASDAGCEVVDAQDMTRIAELISDRMAVRVAGEPRIPFDSTVRIYTGSRRMQLRARDLSSSGVALWGAIEGACPGDPVELELTLGLDVIVAPSRIVRINDEAHDPNVGLAFEEEGDRQRIAQYITAVMSAHQDRRDSVNSLFDDLTADLGGRDPLHTGDITAREPTDDLGGSVDDALITLASRVWGEQEVGASWLQEVELALTAVERVALEKGRPSVFIRGVALRIRLGKNRASGSTVVTEELFNDCIRFVDELANYRATRNDVTDLIEIRTWFIRELAAPVGASKQMTEILPTIDVTTAVS